MKKFTILWFGQLVSIMGTGMTRFALILWIYTKTNNVTETALLGFFSLLPFALTSPFAGIIVDKYSRKSVMLIADIGAALGTGLMFTLLILGHLDLWVIYMSSMVAGICEAFQSPAYTASITLMMPEEKYTKANAMRSFSDNASRMLAPMLAGALMVFIGLKGIMIIDLITFFIGTLSLLIIKIPNPAKHKAYEIGRITVRSVLRSFSESYTYIRKVPGLMTLVKIFVVINLITGITYYGIFPAYILARTGNDQLILGTVEMLLGLGGVIGAVIVGILKAPKNRVKVIFYSLLISYITGDVALAIGRNVYIWGISTLITSIFIVFAVTSATTIWQVKIAPEIQGRVFAFRQMINILPMTLGYLTGGLLADYIFEPLMKKDVLVVQIVSKLVGTGSGSGMAFMLIITAFLGVLISIFGLFNKKLKQL
ncbi:MAG: MFS transporter [Vallitaleaceae bacterium]|nr:MFS transporter [Vallitaleaceae bacterium]